VPNGDDDELDKHIGMTNVKFKRNKLFSRHHAYYLNACVSNTF